MHWGLRRPSLILLIRILATFLTPKVIGQVGRTRTRGIYTILRAIGPGGTLIGTVILARKALAPVRVVTARRVGTAAVIMLGLDRMALAALVLALVVSGADLITEAAVWGSAAWATTRLASEAHRRRSSTKLKVKKPNRFNVDVLTTLVGFVEGALGLSLDAWHSKAIRPLENAGYSGNIALVSARAADGNCIAVARRRPAGQRISRALIYF